MRLRNGQQYAIYVLSNNPNLRTNRIFHGIVTWGVAYKFVRDNPSVDKLIVDMTTGSEVYYNAHGH
jgi:hypothetical protein